MNAQLCILCCVLARGRWQLAGGYELNVYINNLLNYKKKKNDYSVFLNCSLRDLGSAWVRCLGLGLISAIMP